MKILLYIYCVWFLALSFPEAKTYLEIQTEQRLRLDRALEHLKTQRTKIKEESIPLHAQYNALIHEVKELRSKVSSMERLRDSRSIELEDLTVSVASKEKEMQHITRVLFTEYMANFETHISLAERERFSKQIRDYQAAEENIALPPEEKLSLMIALMKTTLHRTQELFHSQYFEGGALNEKGILTQGHYLKLGPLLYFSSADSTLSGIVTHHEGSLKPSIHPVIPKEIRDTLNAGKGVLPVDPTLGYVLTMSQTKDTLLMHLDKGGVWVYPIMLFALIASLAALGKSWQIFRIRLSSSYVLHTLLVALKKGNLDEAKKIAEMEPPPCRQMLLDALSHCHESAELVEEVMYETLLDVEPRLERFLNIIAVTAASAPLLGLLGTVTGIIKTFELMAVFGSGNPKPLITGISEALITTELGLILAIPALILHAILSRKVTSIMSQMEKIAVTFVNGFARTKHDVDGGVCADV